MVTMVGWGKRAILKINASISRTIRDMSTVTTRKLHMRFRLTPGSMTLDDLKLLKVIIFVEFRRFERQQQLNK